jgi:hypothetical protein
MSEKAGRTEDRLADFTRDKRILLLSLMALLIGCVSAFVAYALVWLISVITSLAFYQRFSSEVLSPDRNTLGPFVVVVPAVGGRVTARRRYAATASPRRSKRYCSGAAACRRRWPS